MRAPARAELAPTPGGSFALGVTRVVLLSALLAALIAPLIAFALAKTGFHVVFPRIFDRVVMVTAVGILLLSARTLGVNDRLREGFDSARGKSPQLLAGFAAALAIILVLMTAAAIVIHQPLRIIPLVDRAIRFILPAAFIAIFEEAFFRAFLLGGLRREFTTRTALIASSIVYALAHLVRSPRHYYLSGFHPGAGFVNLAASCARLIHPDGLILMVFGLFLLGLVLGEAFILTGSVYLSIGLHAGFILGAKCWPVVAGAHPSQIPGWLAGPGPVPLIAAPAAWFASIVLLLGTPFVEKLRRGKRSVLAQKN